ncbi:hypothetical protein LXA43DRAFT_1055525 [Ganoderma leucocontextum]|nr:hypothetical protein LXA43DRAFT_1055525 [Ganoderma leucocontextum]
MKLPPPPPRPLLDPYLLDRTLRPQNGSRDTHVPENDCHSGWHVFSSTRTPGMPHSLPANVDSACPCRRVFHPPPPTPSTSPSQRCHYRRRPPRMPSPRDKAACTRFRLAKKKPLAVLSTPLRSATPAIAPSFRPLPRMLCIVVQMVRLAAICTRRLSSGIGGGIRRTCSTMERTYRSALLVPSDICQALLALRVPQALSVIIASFLAKRTVHHPHGVTSRRFLGLVTSFGHWGGTSSSSSAVCSFGVANTTRHLLHPRVFGREHRFG